MKALRRWVPFVLATVSLVSRADLFELYGFGPRAAAMGGALTAEANDHTAVFYNPARLVDRKEVNFGLTFGYQTMVSDVKSTDSSKSLDCSNCKAPDSYGTSVGLVLPFGGKVQDYLSVGLGIYVPASVMLRLNSPPPSTPYWYRYHANPERLQLFLGAGIKIIDQLKLGLGAHVLANLIGTSANVSVDLFSKEVKSGDINAYLGTRVGPIFSVLVTPIPRLRIGATFKWEMRLDYQIPAKVDLSGIGTLAFVIQGTAHYSPHTLNFGAAFDVTDDFTIALDGEWQNWSAAPSPYVGVVIDLSGATLEALGLGSALDVTSANRKAGFSDTLGVRAGGEYRVNENVALRLGGFLRPTPVPKQETEGTNLLDNTTVGATLGVGFAFKDPLGIFQNMLKFDLAGQSHFVLARTTKKDPVDPQAGYTASATVFGVTGALRYDF